MSNKFWLENPCKLFSSFKFFPSSGMTKDEKMNALTRLALIITGIMYAMKYEHTLTFLIVSILAIIGMYYSEDDGPKATENFTVVPTYLGNDFQQTTVAPLFAEEWQIPPPAYDLYTEVPYPDEGRDTFEEPLQPQSYPYGQYLTRTNLLPSDEYYTHLGCGGGARSAREYANSTFLRNSLAHQDNMMRLYRKKLNRRFRQNTQDTFSPFSSY